MNEKNIQRELFDLAQYLAASAEGLQNEPKSYGPLRLLEVLNRISNLMESTYGDDFMGQVAKEVEQNKDRVMTDEEEFHKFLHRLVIKFAREAKKRV